jgi:hypothetical protein
MDNGTISLGSATFESKIRLLGKMSVNKTEMNARRRGGTLSDQVGTNASGCSLLMDNSTLVAGTDYSANISVELGAGFEHELGNAETKVVVGFPKKSDGLAEDDSFWDIGEDEEADEPGAAGADLEEKGRDDGSPGGTSTNNEIIRGAGVEEPTTIWDKIVELMEENTRRTSEEYNRYLDQLNLLTTLAEQGVSVQLCKAFGHCPYKIIGGFKGFSKQTNLT